MYVQDDSERTQRALNEAKKREIERRYGGTFRGGATLPPQVEAEWLAHIEEFERQFEAAGQTTVRRYCGNPAFTPLNCLPAGSVTRELARLLGVLAQNNIEVHFGGTVSDGEAYRFITEELLDEPMDDIRIEGMTQNFLYEEFHPDDRSDASMYAELFARQLFCHPDDALLVEQCCQGELCRPDGSPGTMAGIREQIDAFRRGTAAFLDYTVTTTECAIGGEHAAVRLQLSWSGLRQGSMEPHAGRGEAFLRLKKAPGSEWLLVQLRLPDTEESDGMR